MYGRIIKAREQHLSQRDKNRYVRPFEWGTEFIRDRVNGDDPHELLLRHADEVMNDSEHYYSLNAVSDYKLDGEELTWTSAITTPDEVNNTVRARYFPAAGEKTGNPRRAVVILPQWNAQPGSHIELARILQRLGISAVRVALPYHEARRPAHLERADHLVSSNIGRTIQSMRQAVLDARAAVHWLAGHGYKRIGIIGTSIGSCTAFLTLVHEPRINVGVFNHVSGYFADVVWKGISTRHVRDGFGEQVTLEQLRKYWIPISPLPFISKLSSQPPRPMRFIAARYDMTFPVDLSREVIAEVRRREIPLDVTWLPCGHYTSGEKPWIFVDGWKIVTYFRKYL